MTDDLFLGLAIGVITAFVVVALSPRPSHSQHEWDLQRVNTTQKQHIEGLSVAYMAALRRAAVCTVEPVDRREVPPK